MKTICMVALTVLSLAAQAQRYKNVLPPAPIPVDSATGAPVFQQVIEVNGLPDILIKRTRSWIAKTYNSANDIIQQYDPEAGILIANGVFKAVYTEYQPMFGAKTRRNLVVYHTLTIEAKSGRCRITIDGLRLRKADQNAYGYSLTPTPYLPAVLSDSIELSRIAVELQQNLPMTGKGWAIRNAPIYLATDRDIDTAVYERAVFLINDFKQFMSKAEKDW